MSRKNEQAFRERAAADALADQGRWQDAAESYRALAEAGSQDEVLFHNWGVTLRELARPQEAIAAFEQALGLKPSYAKAFHGLSLAYRDLGAADSARMAIELALENDPGRDIFRLELIDQLIHAGEWDAALQQADRFDRDDPGYPVAQNLKGLALRKTGSMAAALDAFGHAIDADPRFAAPLQNRANLHLRARRFSLAVADFDAAIALAPQTAWLAGLRLYAAMHVFDWRGHAQQRQTLLKRVEAGEPVAQPLIVQHLTDDPALQQVAAKTWAARTLPTPRLAERHLGFPAGRKIRIAYVSRDFHSHPVAYLIAEVLALHDRQVFDVAVINYGSGSDDPMQRRLRAGVDAFLDVQHSSDEQIVQICRELSIDIAVDLTGYTDHARSAIFAHRIAPVQVLYLGYLGTAGAALYDYVVADRYLVDERTRGFVDEKLMVLPSYQANDRQRPRPAGGDQRAIAGLPENAFVFCCFNNPAKLTPSMFAAWARILGRVPGSVLWLLAEEDEAIRNLRSHAAELGLDPAWLVFADRCDRETYLARLASADLFLDTLPYNAGTTASDALWMGLPVLTQAGQSFAGRMASSLLHAVGLPELVVATQDEYVDTAVALATDGDSFNELRNRLQENRDSAVLFDTPAFTRCLELAYLTALSGTQEGDIAVGETIAPHRSDTPWHIGNTAITSP
ncbi:tetratricopeptide repeat protein [Mitsuaria sp. 7]|uniref:O-linked N-acetylglucosamine transferase, SPINDLY family protein n=1 Tax=Mitsuaria sp. 7 TaxID=1658665 RepID=UPI00082D5CDD|nr:tetratricopeptide repeat protein [Mitsuaria sp. 7]